VTAHLSQHAITASLVPGAARPRCEVPGCTACEAALDEAHGAARDFRDQILPRTLPAIRARLERPAPWWRAKWWLTGPLAMAAAAAVALAVWPRAPEPAVHGGDPVITAKGGPSDDDLRIFVKRGGAVHRLAGDGAVQPGDSIRFVVEPRGARYALVVSLDAKGAYSVYAPFDGAASLALAGGELPAELPDSVVLDDTLGDERLWLVLSDAPISAAAVRPQLERGGQVSGARVIAVTLHKGLAGR
jgi:hypothetical protein